MLAAKLKNIKATLKRWNLEILCRDEEQIKTLRVTLNTLDTLAELIGLIEEESKERMDSKRKLLDLENKRVEDMRQKARIRWAMEGDENSSFFHGMYNSRLTVNRVNGIFVKGLWSTSPKA
ncbi:hypothetical protein L1987_06174 [Smallanthus sonchifolius]|uniref:Uncharacterized protein n=1 Tax=Smallanthus sonchifolius TaxID=185202 RepID=A0ACB9JXK5_9ASTR|nr:hypothetical protein L1987_06174 [Smallanthus sonchifolius]